MMTYHEDVNEKSIYDLQGLKEIKKQPDILSRIKLHVTPRMVMEPWFLAKSEDLQKLKEITDSCSLSNHHANRRRSC